MAKKKSVKTEIVGNLDPKYWVQKSDPLVMMRSVPFSLGELKILDTYISRINASDDSRCTVIFTKEEYEKLIGLSCDYRTLEKHTSGMLSKVVTLEMPNGDFMKFTLFQRAYYHKDEYGKPVIELSCTPLAKDLFFCIGKYHYFKYALKNIINLTRKASYLLYLYIRTNRYRGTWEISLDELRDKVLDCKKQESYKEYKIFRRDVLNPAVKEVNAKTDCHFEYEALKRGRRVVEIKFIYHSEELPKAKDMVLENSQNMDKELWEEALCKDNEPCEFTSEQIEEIRQILITIPKYKMPQDVITHTNDITFRRYHYIAQQYALLNRKASEVRIHNRFGYFIKMLKKDADLE